MPSPVDAVLGRYAESDITVKLLWALFDAIPGAPPQSLYTSLAEAQMLIAPDLDEAAFARAEAWSTGPAAKRILNITDALDTGDAGITVISGIRSALGLFFGQGAKALDTDPQQGADAALKALGLGAIVHSLPGSDVRERVAAIRRTSAGESLLHYYVAVELALPFADDLAMGATQLVTSLLEKHGGGVVARLERLLGAGSGSSARESLAGLLGPFDEVAGATRLEVGKIATTASKYLPTAISSAGTVAGAVATGADVLPVWRLLGARLVAEIALDAARRNP